MEFIDEIPIGKIKRASKVAKTGAKVGINYLKYNVEKLLSDNNQKAKDKLDKANAETIYDGLKGLKGSALKAAQMLSLDKSIMPQAYVDQFSLSQFSVPPLSPALVLKTFKTYFGKSPTDLFDEFDLKSIFAASIGQVHQAKKNDKTLAVKIQYPGVSDSISSDLALLKPIAIRMFNIKGEGSDQYFKEVENKLKEETDYILELKQSQETAAACKHIDGLVFPNFYEDLSSDRIITMDWMEGAHISEFAKNNTNQDLANDIGQRLWNFYMFQIHTLKKVHADPHPGNFLVSKDKNLVVLDFGCMKALPDDFYTPYFELIDPNKINNRTFFEEKLNELAILRVDDSAKERAFFKAVFFDLLSLLTKPFHSNTFDFSDDVFFEKISNMSLDLAKKTELKNMNGNRGSKHFIYMNRTFFGLYNLLNMLRCNSIQINQKKFIPTL